MGWDQMPVQSFAFTPQKAHRCIQRKGARHGSGFICLRKTFEKTLKTTSFVSFRARQ